MAGRDNSHDVHLDVLQRAVGQDYTITSQLLGGGMSKVFLADDNTLTRRVVIKVLPRELAGADAIDRFKLEIALLASIQHPQIVPILATGEVDGLPYFVMPFVDGVSLRRRLARGPMSVREAVSTLIDVTRALSFAHNKGVVHRDIKPDNILLTASSAVVADFGVAKAMTGGAHRKPLPLSTPAGGGITTEGISLGTPSYMAPEQVVGDPDIDHRADLYALGIVAYEMLAGKPPFAGAAPHKILTAQIAEAPAPLSRHRNDVPAGLDRLIMQCLQKDPANRPRSASDVMRALQSPDLLSAAPESQADRRRAARAPTLISRAWNGAMSLVRNDLRVAVRGLLRTPAVTVSAILCLALGLGVTAAISSAVDRALLQPLPFAAPDRLVTIYRTVPKGNTWPFSAPNYTDLAAASSQLQAFAAMRPNSALVSLSDKSIQAARVRVTGNLFPMLGARALRGRLLGPADDSRSENRAVVVSEEFWRQYFGADTSLVSRTILVDGQAATVVGIVPSGFRVPHESQVIRGDIWEPMRFTATEMAERGSNFLYGVGRLAPNATVDGAQQELVGIFDRIVKTNADLKGESVRVVPLQADSVASVRTALLLLFGAVWMVLLIAATNVASLLLARGVQRQRETAIRTALGGTRWAVMRPVLAESLLLALTGVAVGLGLAWIGVRTIGSLAAVRLPQLAGLTVDMRIVVFALAIAVIVAALCAAVPAWNGTKVDPQDAMRGGRGSSGREHKRALGALVTMEVALSLMLLIGAGLSLRGFTTVLGNDPGFDPASLLTLRVRISPQDYADGSSVRRFLEPALAAVRQVPGVEAAGAISHMLYQDWGDNSNIRYEGQPADNPTKMPIVEYRAVTPEFFGVTKQRLVEGRLLRDADDGAPHTPPVVVVNEALAKRDFPAQSAVGKRFYNADTGFATIVGVVSDIRNFGPVTPPQPEMYWSYRESGSGSVGFSILVRVKGGNPASVASGVQTAIRSVDKGAAMTSVLAMPEVISASVGRPRFLFALMGVFAAVALLLAVAGLYGVMNYAVAQRTRELGIRAALGSTPAITVRLVARDGMVLVGMGVVLGLVGGAALTRFMVTMLYGVSPLDAQAWMAAVAAMVVAGILAVLVPSLRATRVNPLIALRSE